MWHTSALLCDWAHTHTAHRLTDYTQLVVRPNVCSKLCRLLLAPADRLKQQRQDSCVCVCECVFVLLLALSVLLLFFLICTFIVLAMANQANRLWQLHLTSGTPLNVHSNNVETLLGGHSFIVYHPTYSPCTHFSCIVLLLPLLQFVALSVYLKRLTWLCLIVSFSFFYDFSLPQSCSAVKYTIMMLFNLPLLRTP